MGESSTRYELRCALWALAAAFVLAGCASPVKTAYHAAEGTDFSRFRSYAWVTEDLMTGADPHAAGYISPLDDARLRKALETQLNNRGLRKVALEGADLAVAFSVTREQKVKSTVSADTQVYYRGSDGMYDYGGPGVTTETYIQGTLTIQLFDRATRQVVWAGWGSKRLSKQHEPPEVIRAVVENIMSKYPPPNERP